MQRILLPERPGWRKQAEEFGFKFHTIHGEAYWDESAYYQFSLRQIEEDLEAATENIYGMCLQAVDTLLADEKLLRQFQIPEAFWDTLAYSWQQKQPDLYARIDLAYDGSGPAKLYENNADTPTSVYESGFWQWLWLEDNFQRGRLGNQTDQFNSLQEKLIERFAQLKQFNPEKFLYFSCCKDSEEDRVTVQYLQDCAEQAEINCQFIYIEDLGRGEGDWLTDLDDRVISWLFKLYPWEFMLREEYSDLIDVAQVDFIEPLWKAVLSNKALLALLWQMFPKHPNLLPAYFESDLTSSQLSDYVKKPIFSREGANIAIFRNKALQQQSPGPYGEEGYIYQAYHPLPCFDGNYTLIGSWLVGNQAAGISIREDSTLITQDTSRFLPHVIVD